MNTPGLRVEVCGGAAWIVDGIVSILPLPPVELEDMGGYIYNDPRIRGRGQALEEPIFRDATEPHADRGHARRFRPATPCTQFK
jgi:hypothetical protein